MTFHSRSPAKTPLRPRSFGPASFAATVLLAALCAVSPAGAAEGDPVRVLFVTKSSGFEHSVIRQTGGAASHASKILEQLAGQHDFTVVATKNAGRVSRSSLKDFDVVIFYTTGDLTQAGGGEGIMAGDGNPPMGPEGLEELMEWIEDGGGFIGFHSATDTFHGEGDEVSPYVAMIGGEFLSHGRQFEGTVVSEAPEHPVMKGFPPRLTIMDEWYLFKNQFADGEEKFDVLARLAPGAARKNQARLYDVEPYPIIWTRTLGQGRVLYNAMGHREDVWSQPDFQGLVARSIAWAAGRE